MLLLLFGLIFRGVAFEFRHRSNRMRWLWDRGFRGSTVVAFVQGAAVGAMMRGIPVANSQFAGGPFGWSHPFPVLTGLGLVLGYALLGAGWLVLKMRRRVARLGVPPGPMARARVRAVLSAAASRSRWTRASSRCATGRADPRRSRSPRWASWRSLGLGLGVWRRHDWMPFATTVLFFVGGVPDAGRHVLAYMIP